MLVFHMDTLWRLLLAFGDANLFEVYVTALIVLSHFLVVSRYGDLRSIVRAILRASSGSSRLH